METFYSIEIQIPIHTCITMCICKSPSIHIYSLDITHVSANMHK
jgi:hypothetical protein